MSHPFQAISLFSGCGGDTLGLEQAGFKVVAFNEFKKFAIDTHLANFPDSILLKDGNNSDITKVPDSVFTPYKGKVQVVFAGFPCQGFSNMGNKNSADPRNLLFRSYRNVISWLNPTSFIFENVKGFRSMFEGRLFENVINDFIKNS